MVQEREFYQLIEFDESLLAALESGQVKIKGSLEDDAILVTKDRSFLMKQVITSNSLMIVGKNNPFSSFSASSLEAKTITIQDSHSCHLLETTDNYWELAPIRGKVDKILSIFQNDHLFDGQQVFPPLSQDQISIQQLQELIQASEFEIAQALLYLCIVEVEGSLYRLTDSFLFICAKTCMTQLVLASENPDSLSEHFIESILQAELQLLPEIWKFLFQHHFIRKRCVCRKSIIKAVVREAFGKRAFWPLGELIEYLEEEISFAFTVDMSLLDEICIQKISSTSSLLEPLEKCSLMLLDEKYLPFDLMLRIKELFNLKSKWKKEEIFPFLRPISSDEKVIEATMLKCSRVYVDSNCMESSKSQIYVSRNV